MKDNIQPGTVASSTVIGHHSAWLLGLVALLVWQGWLTLGLFDSQRSPRGLLDDEPILSGRHPLHLYHGYLGARTLFERGGLSCYDPAFHAGYPKTPVFDSGSRPAELALALAGGRYSPAAYKLALAAFCMLAPLALYVAARGADLSRGVSVLATVLGLLVWWGRPGRTALDAGDVDLLLAALMLLAQAGLMVRYHRWPGPFCLLGVVVTGLIAWFAHPLLAILVLPLFLLYYVTVGHRHRLVWHAPLFAGLLLALGGNAFWLHELVTHWWIRVPLCRDTPLLAHRCFRSWWQAPLWGEGFDKGLACFLVAAGAVGVVLLHRDGKRVAARLLGLGALGFLALSLAGTSWEPFARLGSSQLLAPALLFASLPAAMTLARLLDLPCRWSGTAATSAILATGLIVGIGLVVPGTTSEWGPRLLHPRPFDVGLGEARSALVSAVAEQTSPQARILWEDRRGGRGESRWTALLPLLTGRAFVGGLDAEADIEHASSGLVDQRLAGRPLAEWSDADLDSFCRKYNVGWIACWSPGAIERFGRWPGAASATALPGGSERLRLFALKREPSYALTGSVTWRHADTRGILLADAKPLRVGNETDGQIVLSLHYQAGMRVRPSRVRLEQAVDSQDTIPFIRLRMTEPVGRIWITWEGR